VSGPVPDLPVFQLPAAKLFEHLRGPDVFGIVLAARVEVGRGVEGGARQVLDVHHFDADVVADAGVFEEQRHLCFRSFRYTCYNSNRNESTHNRHERHDVLGQIRAVVLVHFPVRHHFDRYVQLLRYRTLKSKSKLRFLNVKRCSMKKCRQPDCTEAPQVA